MKKIIFSILFIISSLFSAEVQTKIDWVHDYKEALELAKESNKNIYLYISADSCRLCKRFKRDTLSRKCVKARLNSDFIPLNLARERHFIPEKFEKFGAPRHYFLNPQGKIIYEINGVFKSDSFLEILDDIEMYMED